MSVIFCNEIHDGRGGSSEINRKKSVRQYTRVFRVITDSNFDGAAVVLAEAAVPRVGEPYPSDPYAWCRKVIPENDSRGKRIWKVTATYSSEYEPAENPLAEPAHITWKTENFQRPYFFDKDANAILNSAGDMYDPPVEGDDTRWVASVVKNLAAVPSWILDYKDAVNSDAFTLDGISVDVRQAKLSGISISDWQTRNDIRFRVVQLDIHLDKKLWSKKPLNAGFRCLMDGVLLIPCYNGDGTKVSQPALLDANGDQIDSPTPNDATYGTFWIYQEKPFSALPLV